MEKAKSIEEKEKVKKKNAAKKKQEKGKRDSQLSDFWKILITNFIITLT